jgi:hypothetical protein
MGSSGFSPGASRQLVSTKRTPVRAVSPAPVLATLELLAADKPLSWWRRKAALLQLARGGSTALTDAAGAVLAVFGLLPVAPEHEGEDLLLLWFHIRRDAPQAVRPMARLWRLTLSHLRETPIRIRATVAAGDSTGRRLARIAGMAFAGDVDGEEHWEWHGKVSEPDLLAADRRQYVESR